MKRALLFGLLLLGCGTAYGDEPATFVLTSHSIGSVKVGAQLKDLERALHQALPYNRYDNHGCSLVTSVAQEPYGISYMIETSRVTRLQVDFYGTDPRPLQIKTAAGIGLGSSEDDLKKAYAGHMRIEPNDGDPTWHTIYVDEPDGKSGMAFETDGKKVKAMRAGEYPSLAYKQGCSTPN